MTPNSATVERKTERKAVDKRRSQLKPTRAKFTTSGMELGIVWPPTWLELAGVGLNLIKLKFIAPLEPSFPPFGHLSPSCFVIIR